MTTVIITREERAMPMIDVYAPADIFPADADEQLGHELTYAVLRAEGVAQPGPFHLDNTAAFIHRLPSSALSTAATAAARSVRVQIITPPGSLDRDGQRQITSEATDIIARTAGDPGLAARTWVILSEAAEGGWGIAGTAFGVEEFTALARRAAEAKAAAAQ
jgi:phenylpyruvate tautomerase PptA (4-oxalocrotonate tautomerase family)